jgi:hypothetical protein
MNLSVGNFDLRMPSANGDRQMFPKQTNFDFHKNYNVSFYEYRLQILNCLSVATRLSTVLQACSTA